MEFKEFSKIHRWEKTTLLITQKLHGTNASLWIEPVALPGIMKFDDEHLPFITSDGQFWVRPAKRTSFINLENDNFGFASWVSQNKDALAKALGAGTWFGEWVGPGINSGEGLTEKRLALFNVLALQEKKAQMEVAGLWPERLDLVPVLYFGQTTNIEGAVNSAMATLKESGSQYVQGFMRPEGVVISVLGTSAVFKNVFEVEETQWRKPSEKKTVPVEGLDISHLLQPIRLEKLLSRDQNYVRNLPDSLRQIASDYVADLFAEGQLDADIDKCNAQRKAVGKVLFGFIKSELSAKGIL